MSESAALKLVTGRTVHARFTPFEQRFSYGLMMVDVDIDRLDEARKQTHLFSIDKTALYSLNKDDHGSKGATSLRDWAISQLAKADVDAHGLTLRMLTFPRHLFYRFAPLTVWFASDDDGALEGVIYEVNNTFGESHTYVAKTDGSVAVSEADKSFHVSPFFDITGKYKFTLRKSADRISLVIDTLVDGERTHMATITASSQPATDAALLKSALRRPLSAMGVTTGIHWEALKIWLKGAGYRSKPKPPKIGYTVAKPIKS
ncbi:MAG: DUF1365 domain-containing protein [Pseudomonadota bacterium]